MAAGAYRLPASLVLHRVRITPNNFKCAHRNNLTYNVKLQVRYQNDAAESRLVSATATGDLIDGEVADGEIYG